MAGTVETLVVGAGIIGSSVAWHLAKMGMTGVRVIDFDLEGSLSSTELNAGGVRATWNQPLNIEMSKLSIDYFASVATEVGFRACGYLWLHSNRSLPNALQAREKQISRGWPVEIWDTKQLQAKIPFIDKTTDIEAAFFSPRDGLINPNLLKNHFRALAKQLGVVFDDRTLLRASKYIKKPTQQIEVAVERFEPELSVEMKKEVLSGDFRLQSHQRTETLITKRIINCAGAWASEVAQILGYSSPSYPVRRQISIFDCREVDLSPYGMIVDTSGVYFHPEASNGLAGFATHDEPRGINYHYEGESFFMESIWPALYERSTCFERLKHLTGWAGLYDVSPDDNAILGTVDRGEPKGQQNVFEAHSFSGHGVMQSYAAGLLLAEKIVKGNYQTLDAGSLSAERFETGSFLRESLVI